MSKTQIFRRRSSLLSKSSHGSEKNLELVKERDMRCKSLSDSASDVPALIDTIGTRDLATLAQLDEERLVAELKLRYQHGLIYTNVGDILIAINPFKEIDGLYGDEAIKKYLHSSAPCFVPHVFRISQLAYKLLLVDHRNQCCVISGESGAGKTETAKFLVEHILATCQGKGSLEQKIMEVNPLLEAFGNAKTVINDNSSRFGKYLEIKFGYFGEVLGARLAEYLLEKSRVVRQAEGERNFHVFYYLFSGLDDTRKKEYGLSDTLAFHYLRGGSKNSSRDDAFDIDQKDLKSDFKALLGCMRDIGFTEEEIDHTFLVLAGILHIGNVEFVPSEKDTATIANPAPVSTVAKLFGLSEEELAESLVSTYHITRGERLMMDHTVEQAEDCRDAMAKALYGRLFTWIVEQANTLLAPRGRAYEDAKGREGAINEIGILDIFGFENFVNNSFEQFCINVANEQLQYYFNHHIFAMEQSEYIKEGIDIARVNFIDNKPCLDMVLMKPLGIFALLDEESRFPRATPATLVEKYNSTAGKMNWHFFQEVDPKTIRQQSSTIRRKNDRKEGSFFTVNHYAGKVLYDAEYFLEKNRDSLSANIVGLLKTSSCALVKRSFTEPPAPPQETDETMRKAKAAGQNGGGRPTVSAHFKNSLLELMEKMHVAKPHFIRCIKPNMQKKPGNFIEASVLTQLKYTGVLETTRIRRDGYALRLPFRDFITRYGTLALKIEEIPKAEADEELLMDACELIVKRTGLKGSQMGRTMIFLKYYHNETLVRMKEKMIAASVHVTRVVRGFLARRQLKRLREAKAKAEREAAEKALREKLEQERIAAEQARIEMERQQREAAERAKLASLRAIKQLAAEKERQEKLRLEMLEKERQAREAAEKLRLEAEEREREEAEKRRIEEEKIEKQKEERRLRQQREQEEAAKLQALQEEREKQLVVEEEERRLRGGSGVDDTAVFTFDDSDDIFNDESIDPFEREILKQNRKKREYEEFLKKKKLQDEFRLQQMREKEAQMKEMQRIIDRERQEREEKERKIAADADAAAERMKTLTFGTFSWGAPSFDTAPPPLPPPPQVEASTPASSPSTPDNKRNSVFGFLGGNKKKHEGNSPRRPSTVTENVSSSSLPPLPPSPQIPSNLTSDATPPPLPPQPTGSVRVLPPHSPSRLAKSASPPDFPLPPLPPPPSDPLPLPPSDQARQSVDSMSLPPPPTDAQRLSIDFLPLPSPPSNNHRESLEFVPLPPPPSELLNDTPSSPSTLPSSDLAPPSSEVRLAPPSFPPPLAPPPCPGTELDVEASPGLPPLPPPPQQSESSPPDTPTMGRKAPPVAPKPKPAPKPGPANADSNASSNTRPVIENSTSTLPEKPESQKQSETTTATPVVTETAPALPPPPVVETPSQPEAPRPRRELIRGRKKEENYLPGYKEAMAAIENLDKYLDENLLLLEGPPRNAAADDLKTVGSTTSQPACPEHVQIFEEVLLKEHPRVQLSNGRHMSMDEPTRQRWLCDARVSKDVLKLNRLPDDPPILSRITPQDLVNLDENQRVALLDSVRSGNITVDQALIQVIERRNQAQNCTVM